MMRHIFVSSTVLAVSTLLAMPQSQAQTPSSSGEPRNSDPPVYLEGGGHDSANPTAPDHTASGTSGPASVEIPTEPSRAGSGLAPVPVRTSTDLDSDAAAAATVAAAAPSAAVDVSPPPVAEEVKGTCETPRQAWLQLLHWLQKDESRWRPEEAAKCFDARGFDDPAEVRRRAAMFKETLDSHNVWIRVNRLPIDANYRNQNGHFEYREPASTRSMGNSVYVEKINGKWLFSRETVARIPDMYPVTGMIEHYVPSWLKFTIAGVEAWKYLLLLLVYLLGRLLRFMVVLVLDRYIERLAERTKSKYLNKVVDRAGDPIGLLVMALVFYVCLPSLLLPIRFTDFMLVAIKGFAAYAGVWLGYRLIDVLTDYMMAKAEGTDSKLDDQLVPLVSKTLKVFVSVVGGIFILQNLDVNVGSLLAGVGLGGLAFALAAKDTIANFFGSIMIFIDKPFQIGDWVVIGNTEGVIEEVGFRTSRVRTFYNSLVTVPNALVTNAVVDNYGARQYRRYVSNLGLTYDTPPDKVEAFCAGVRAIIAGMPGMRKDFYLVEFKEFGDSGLIIMLYCFMEVDDWNQELRTRTALNLEIMRMADKLGVSFAFPTQTLHVSSLAKPGEENPSHYGPRELDELNEVVEGFGPGGTMARPKGLLQSNGYYPKPAPSNDEKSG